jgi:hypothetical protein
MLPNGPLSRCMVGHKCSYSESTFVLARLLPVAVYRAGPKHVMVHNVSPQNQGAQWAACQRDRALAAVTRLLRSVPCTHAVKTVFAAWFVVVTTHVVCQNSVRNVTSGYLQASELHGCPLCHRAGKVRLYSVWAPVPHWPDMSCGTTYDLDISCMIVASIGETWPVVIQPKQ